MADTGTTRDRKRRSVTESEFFSNVEQLEWLEKQNARSNGALIESLRSIHKPQWVAHCIYAVTFHHEKAPTWTPNTLP